MKVEAVKNYGAVVDLVDVNKVGREERVQELMNEFRALCAESFS